MSNDFDCDLSLEQLEGERWPDPEPETTGQVKSVHLLRRRPVRSLNPTELARLIGHEVGLRWLLPVAVEILRETAPEQAVGGFYDDDLLLAVLVQSQETWQKEPELAQEIRDTIGILTDLGEWVEPDAKRFLAMFTE